MSSSAGMLSTLRMVCLLRDPARLQRVCRGRSLPLSFDANPVIATVKGDPSGDGEWFVSPITDRMAECFNSRHTAVHKAGFSNRFEASNAPFKDLNPSRKWINPYQIRSLSWSAPVITSRPLAHR